jgi:hypothetical protein
MIVGLGFLLAMPLSVVWAAFGTDHQARVERTWTTRRSKGGYTYRVAYAYPLGPGGAVRHDEAVVSARTYRTLTAHRPKGGPPATLRVRSIGSAPPLMYDGVIEAGGSPWSKVGMVWFFATFWNGVLSVFVYILYLAPRRVRRLYRSGIPVAGRIVSKRDWRGGKSTAYYVRYAFENPDAGPCEREMNVSPRSYQLATPGDAVTILYDPRKPKRSVIYELGPHRCD